MTFEIAFVTKKLEELNGYIGELTDFLKYSDEEIMQDSGKIHVAERLLQLIVDTMIDINQHFIRDLHVPLSEDFQSTFITLGDHAVLSQDFALKLAPVVGLRNRVVHRYEGLDKRRFIELLRKNVEDFKTYIRSITKKIQKQ